MIDSTQGRVGFWVGSSGHGEAQPESWPAVFVSSWRLMTGPVVLAEGWHLDHGGDKKKGGGSIVVPEGGSWEM